MAKYRVYFYTSASCCIEVEAENEDEASDLACEDLPSFPYIRGIGFGGEWEFDDVEEVED